MRDAALGCIVTVSHPLRSVRLSDKSNLSIPEPIAQLQRQLDQFRRAQRHRTKIPEGLWQAAVDLARHHGLYAVALPLRLDYRNTIAGLPSYDDRHVAEKDTVCRRSAQNSGRQARNVLGERAPVFKPSEFASLGYLGAAPRAERGYSISEPNRECNPHPLYI